MYTLDERTRVLLLWGNGVPSTRILLNWDRDGDGADLGISNIADTNSDASLSSTYGYWCARLKYSDMASTSASSCSGVVPCCSAFRPNCRSATVADRLR